MTCSDACVLERMWCCWISCEVLWVVIGVAMIGIQSVVISLMSSVSKSPLTFNAVFSYEATIQLDALLVSDFLEVQSHFTSPSLQ